MAHVFENTAVADDQDDWRLIKNTPQDRLEVNAHSTPQWNYTPEGVLASSPQVGLGGAGLGLRSSELYLKCICSKKELVGTRGGAQAAANAGGGAE